MALIIAGSLKGLEGFVSAVNVFNNNMFQRVCNVCLVFLQFVLFILLTIALFFLNVVMILIESSDYRVVNAMAAAWKDLVNGR